MVQTSADGDKLSPIKLAVAEEETSLVISLNPDKKYQEITGFGGAFTESTAYVLDQLSDSNRKEVIEAYFGPLGAEYSLTPNSYEQL